MAEDRSSILAREVRTEKAGLLMTAFAGRTGLVSDMPPVRYLWTDAFAVCNYLGLSREARGEPERERYKDLAFRLIQQVHEVLGRHRADEARTGWISCLEGQEARLHPTWGGLRIGKPLPERAPAEPFDERVEWDRDGQYFHYLTKWMQALDYAARHTGRVEYARWAEELAGAAATAFAYVDLSGRAGMYWKMSIDLSRPLVTAMGIHDALEGYVMARELLATRRLIPPGEAVPVPSGGRISLDVQVRLFGRMARGNIRGITDLLGVGGLLTDAVRLLQIAGEEGQADVELVLDILSAAEDGLSYVTGLGFLDRPARERLGFRELGLAIGLEALDVIDPDTSGTTPFTGGTALRRKLGSLKEYRNLGEDILGFWLESENRLSPTWTEHEDINSVMLATALAPEGFIVPPRPAPGTSA
jgi:hypothetical protein